MIEKLNLTEKSFRRGRWYATLDKAFGRRRTIPFAHYIWLKENPAFENIPKGYVIHHLDWDETNDDISNLALMQKHHHDAHHWKNKRLKKEIKAKIDRKVISRTEFYPKKKPIIRKNATNDRYYLDFFENIDGKSERRRLSIYNGKRFNTIEEAKIVRDIIWKDSC